MSLLLKEWEAKVDLIRSIARSQLAVARILESVADVTAHSPDLAKTIGDHMRSVAALQRAMAETAGFVRIGRPQEGVPTKPWLRRDVLDPAARPHINGRNPSECKDA